MRIEDLNLSDADRRELLAAGERAADAFENDFAPDPAATVPPEIALRQIRFQRVQLERETVQLVVQARSQGMSWHKIGLALGTTAEGARRRYHTAA